MRRIERGHGLPGESRFQRAIYWSSKPRVQVWFNGVFTLVWALMLPVTYIYAHSFISTVLWVSFISCWALFATHLGAWIAAMVNVRAEEIQTVTNYQAMEAILLGQDRMLAELHHLMGDMDQTLDDLEQHFAEDTYDGIVERAREAGYEDEAG